MNYLYKIQEIGEQHIKRGPGSFDSWPTLQKSQTWCQSLWKQSLHWNIFFIWNVFLFLSCVISVI